MYCGIVSQLKSAVIVDEARRNDGAVRIDDAVGSAGEFADFRDLAVLHPDIATVRRHS
jgi:hypothetical protein